MGGDPGGVGGVRTPPGLRIEGVWGGQHGSNKFDSNDCIFTSIHGGFRKKVQVTYGISLIVVRYVNLLAFFFWRGFGFPF